MFKLLSSVFPSLLPLTAASRRRSASRPAQVISKALESLEPRRLLTAFVVDTLADENDGIGAGAGTSLRDAIEAANANSGDDSISFDPALTSGGPVTITLSLGALPLSDITGPTTITGPGAASLTVSGGNASRIFSISANITATISGLTLSDGNGDGANGGAIHNDGTLTLQSSTLSNNTSTTTGGAIYSGGNLTVSQSTFTNNTSGTDGGAIYHLGGFTQSASATISNSTFTGNTAGDNGGAINNFGTMTVSASSFSNNTADQGGAIANNAAVANEDSLSVTSSTFTSNTAVDGGAIASTAAGGISDSTLSLNTASGNGGAVFSNNIFSISSSTLLSNSATNGGAVYNGNVALIANSTLTGNSATVDGGAIISFSTAFVNNSTITANSAGGGGNTAGGVKGLASFNNSIIAGNTGTNPDFHGQAVFSTYNLIGDGSGVLSGLTNGTNGNKLGTALAPINALLGPLANNGGTTLTMKPLPGSPAIDAGDPNLSSPTTDQRGYTRIAHSRVDIGAVETPFLHFVVARNTGEAVVTGNSVSFDITALDEFNNPVAGYEPLISFSSTDATANLPPDFTLTGGTGSFSATFNAQGSFTITVTDTAASSFLGSTASLSVNDDPTDLAVTPASVAENAASGTTVGTLSTTDTGDAGSHTYTLVAGAGDDDNALFTIDGTTLKTNAVFNFETKSSYTIRVRTTDSGGLFTEKALTINVSDVADGPTDLSLSANTVAENQGSGVTVGTLSTTDPNAGSHTYTLVAGAGSTDNALFTIDGNSIKTGSVFNFETKSSYTIRVRSTDTDGLFSEKAITINVTNVNEAPTDLSLGTTTVAENQPTGATVGTLSTADPDAGDTFSYTLVAGAGADDNALFAIDGSTLKTSAAFDFETKSSYTVRIRSTDAGGLFTEKAITVGVLDGSDAPTDIALSANTVQQNLPAGTVVGNLTGTDPDDSASTLTFSIVPGQGDADNASFSIVGNQLRSAVIFTDFERSEYSVRVRVTDAAGLTTDKTFTINVPNPKLQFVQPPKNVVAGVAMKKAVTVRRLNADGSQNKTDASKLKFNILSGPKGGKIIGGTPVTTKAGVTTFSPLSFNIAGTYVLRVAGGKFGSTTATFNVTPAAPIGIAFTSPKKATVGQPFSLQVRVVDKFGNTVTKDKRPITLSLASGPGGSSLGGKLTKKAVAGVATFDNLTLNSTGTFTLKATGGAFSVVSKAIKITG